MKLGEEWLGMTIEFTGCNSVHPRTFEDTGLQKIFLVTHDGELYPQPITEGPYKNCTAMPEGDPEDHAEKIIKILAKYHDDPEKVYRDIMMEVFHI